MKWLLDILASKELDDDVYVWTETNLIPFLTDPNTGKTFAEGWGLRLNEMGAHRNFSVHPCIHGLDAESMRKITGHGVGISELLEGLKKLMEAGIDVYPSFITDVNPPEKIEHLFEELANIDRNLPLRFALVRHDEYKPVEERLAALEVLDRGTPETYNHAQAFEIWDGLLRSRYRVSYGQIPRHVVPMGWEKDADAAKLGSSERRLAFFKSTYRPEYKDALLRAIFLPAGWHFSAQYDLKYLAPKIAGMVKNIKKGEGNWNSRVVFVFVDREAKPEDDKWARRFRPLRFAQLEGVEYCSGASWATFNFRLGEFLEPRDTWERSSDEIASRFAGGILPLEAKNLYVLPAPELYWVVAGETASVRAWQRVVDTLSELDDFRSDAFLRLESLVDEEGAAVSFDEPIGLRAGHTYTLSIISYLPKIEKLIEEYGGIPKIEVIAESTAIDIRTPTPVLLAKYGRHKVCLVCSDSYKNSSVSISLRPKGDKRAADTVFRISFRLRGRRWPTLLAIVGIAVAVFFVALAELLPKGYESFSSSMRTVGTIIAPLLLLWLTLKYGMK